MELVRRAFAAASIELFTLRSLLSADDELILGQLLARRYEAGASLLVLGAEVGRSTQYVAKVLRRSGVVIRPAFRPPGSGQRVDLVELRRLYEAGASVSGLAARIGFCREATRKFLKASGAQLRG
ncbi:hypothetical protein [Streptacidiphilus sp. P02-A3a]|uniref:helix-turn-helix domain-containing protein n=1 Tax=Streptacidiphilus sp. P02-A3a TaxID=2704468 RepID=UPI0015FBBE33|nr:hypothetical protein [Streptacidiphilus sp. P02-A3a]QMU66818.1 hypothetical protein GXP74_19535 [Streptacidiphilus sp. P02-A3a]QMU66821.1 hypothetical protein GXP74_21825 [Streptacidiphilus sp. P02-A3a]